MLQKLQSMFRHGASNDTTSKPACTDRRPAAHRWRILICEDDPATLLQLKYTFQDRGCEVVALTLGSAAFYRLQTERFDLVVMDYQLPLANAASVMQEMLPWERITIPFVLISSEDRRKEAEDLGFLAFYEKPIVPVVADKIIARHLGAGLRTPEVAMQRPLRGTELALATGF